MASCAVPVGALVLRFAVDAMRPRTARSALCSRSARCIGGILRVAIGLRYRRAILCVAASFAAYTGTGAVLRAVAVRSRRRATLVCRFVFLFLRFGACG